MMEETLLHRYICQQPVLWHQLLAERDAITADFAHRFSALCPDRVILIGSGSSHYASLMARSVLERVWDAEVTCLVPSEAVGARCTAKRPLYLAISQSGVSTNTYELICQLTAAGHPVIAVTEQADSPVGRAATLTVPLRIGEEMIGAKTKGVTATVLTLMLLALSVCRDAAYRAELYTGLERLCDSGEEHLAHAAAWSQSQRDAILPFRHLYVLGCGNGLAAAREGALKLLETNYLPVSCYPLDEYLHGIQNALDASACLICLLPPEGPDRERMLRLVDFARGVGAHCALIDAGADIPEALLPLRYLPALQLLAAELSAARGIDTSRRRYPNFFSLMGSKME